MDRYATEGEARKIAARLSKADGKERYVIESPPREPDQDPTLRFVVDDDGFTRSWERSIAVYQRGKAQEL